MPFIFTMFMEEELVWGSEGQGMVSVYKWRSESMYIEVLPAARVAASRNPKLHAG
jgi:hypothetical protein